MRITRFFPVVLLISSRFLAAAPPSCVQDSLANYIALGAQGCTLGGAVFANFSYSTSGSGGGVPAAQIKVAPTLGIPATPGFTFAAKWHAVAGQSQESVISYSDVSSSSIQTQVLHLDLGPAQIGGIIGSVTVQESTNVGDLNVFLQCVEVCRSKPSDQLSFSAVSVVLVTDHVTLTGGQSGASLSSFSVAFDFCPPCN